eukprot:TRINITY_DN11365_c0_g1_i2.p1 TRINITY_DN11365_c0_g1~~TRINITY_DN11365_c0_g1_i2.p1  ORF type:complete len:1151 (+),score=264.68 TRINITY_DN11365_c0_g1_i2:84-3536(+)
MMRNLILFVLAAGCLIYAQPVEPQSPDSSSDFAPSAWQWTIILAVTGLVLGAICSSGSSDDASPGGGALAGLKTQTMNTSYVPMEAGDNGQSLAAFADVHVERDNVKMQTELGCGRFGTVAEAEVHNLHGTAVQRSVLYASSEIALLPELVDAFTADCMTLRNARHDNVIGVVGAHFATAPTFILLESCSRGSLRHVLRRSRAETRDEAELSVSQQLQLCQELADAMTYLHMQTVVIKDLGARCAMIHQSGRLKLCLAGVGLAVAEDDYGDWAQGQQRLTTVPVRWLAPETLDTGEYSHLSDVYSFGVACWEIMSFGYKPWADMDDIAAAQRTKSGRSLPQPRGCPPDMYQIMQGCWHASLDTRSTSEQVLAQLVAVADAKYDDEFTLLGQGNADNTTENATLADTAINADNSTSADNSTMTAEALQAEAEAVLQVNPGYRVANDVFDAASAIEQQLDQNQEQPAGHNHSVNNNADNTDTAGNIPDADNASDAHEYINEDVAAQAAQGLYPKAEDEYVNDRIVAENPGLLAKAAETAGMERRSETQTDNVQTGDVQTGDAQQILESQGQLQPEQQGVQLTEAPAPAHAEDAPSTQDGVASGQLEASTMPSEAAEHDGATKGPAVTAPKPAGAGLPAPVDEDGADAGAEYMNEEAALAAQTAGYGQGEYMNDRVIRETMARIEEEQRNRPALPPRQQHTQQVQQQQAQQGQQQYQQAQSPQGSPHPQAQASPAHSPQQQRQHPPHGSPSQHPHGHAPGQHVQSNMNPAFQHPGHHTMRPGMRPGIRPVRPGVRPVRPGMRPMPPGGTMPPGMSMDPYGGGHYYQGQQQHYYAGGYHQGYYDPAYAQYYAAQGYMDPYAAGYGYGGGYAPHMHGQMANGMHGQMPPQGYAVHGYGYRPVRPNSGRVGNPLRAKAATPRNARPASSQQQQQHSVPATSGPQQPERDLITDNDANGLHGGVKSNAYVHGRALRESVRRVLDEDAPTRKRSVWGDTDDEVSKAKAAAKAAMAQEQGAGESMPVVPSRPSLGQVTPSIDLVTDLRNVTMVREGSSGFGFNIRGSAPVAITQLDPGGVAEAAGLIVGDVIVRFMGQPVHDLTQKEIVNMFVSQGSNPIDLVVKNLSLDDINQLRISIRDGHDPLAVSVGGNQGSTYT